MRTFNAGVAGAVEVAPITISRWSNKPSTSLHAFQKKKVFLFLFFFIFAFIWPVLMIPQRAENGMLHESCRMPPHSSERLTSLIATSGMGIIRRYIGMIPMMIHLFFTCLLFNFVFGKVLRSGQQMVRR
jgi:hypothetical protein